MVLGGTFVAAVALCEAALWLLAPVPYHEWMIWERQSHFRAKPMPNQIVHNKAGCPVRINKHGFRGPDYDFVKPPGSLRLAVFGGSAGFCFEATRNDRTWPKVLEKKLHERLNMPVQVINLALMGFDSFHSKQVYMTYGRAFEPDAIVVYHCWNDMKMFRRIAKKPYYARSSVPNKPLWQRIARETQLGRRARNFIFALTKRRMEYQTFEGQDPKEWQAPVDARAFAWERTNFEDFAVLARADGVLPVLVSQATLCSPDSFKESEKIRLALSYTPKMTGMTIPLTAATQMEVNAIVQQMAQQYDGIFVDAYNAVPRDLEHFHDVVHLTDAGCRVVGETIADTLLGDERFRAIVKRVRQEISSAASATKGLTP